MIGVSQTAAATSPAPAVPQDTYPCQPIADGDNVHESTKPTGYASGHGWWEQGTCPSGVNTVTITLYEFWTSDREWHPMDTNSGQVGQAEVQARG